MGDNKRRRMYRMLANWSISYIVLTAIAIAVLSFPSNKYSKELRTEIDYINNMHLLSTQEELDETISILRKFCERMSIEKSSVEVLMKADDYDSVPRYLLYEIVKRMRTESMYESNGITLLVYYPALDMIISGDYYAKSDYYHRVMLSDLGFSFSELRSALMDRGRGTRIHELSNGQKHMVAVSRPLNSSRELEDRAIALMLFDLNKMLKSEREVSPSKEIMAIFDPAEGKLISTESLLEKEERVMNEVLINCNGDGYTSFDIDEYLISAIPSKYERWVYIAMSESKDSFSRIARLNGIVLISLLLYILASFCLMLRNLIRSYKPLRDTFDMIPETGAHNGRANDVIGYLSDSISNLATKNQELGSVVQSQQMTIESDIKRRLLTEPDAAEHIGDELLDTIGVRKGDSCCVISFRKKDKDQAVCNRVQELSGKYGIECTLASDLNVYLLWCRDKDILMDGSISIVHEIKKERPEIPVALSGVHPSPSGFYQAYKEAKLVFSYQKINNDLDIIVYGQLNMLPAFRLPEYPSEMENLLLQYIQMGEGEKALEVLKSVFMLNYEETINPESFEFLMSMILGGILRIAGKSMDDVSQNEYRLFISRNSHDIPQAIESLERFILKVSDSKSDGIKRRKDKQKDQLYQDIIRYIGINYANIELNVSYIADKFGISNASLSLLFSEQGEIKPSQYINRVRIDHAKELLISGEALETIAIKCGYASFRTFLRVFKQYEGVTPTQYKTIRHADDSECDKKEDMNEKE